MQTTIDLPDDAFELLKYYSASREETMGETVAYFVRAIRDGKFPSDRQITSDDETGLLLATGGPSRTAEEVRRLAFDE